MTCDPSLLVFFQDSITIEPYVSETAARVPTYGAAVTYQAMVIPFVNRTIVDKDGKAFVPAATLGLPGRVSIDPRSRVTLPSDVLPHVPTRQPPIRAVQPGPASLLNLDRTEIHF